MAVRVTPWWWCPHCGWTGKQPFTCEKCNSSTLRMTVPPPSKSPLAEVDVTGMHRVLIAAILASEDECLIYTNRHFDEARDYSVVQDILVDEKATVLTLRKKQ